LVTAVQAISNSPAFSATGRNRSWLKLRSPDPTVPHAAFRRPQL